LLSFTSLCRPGCSFLWEGDALPLHEVAAAFLLSPFVAVVDCGDGSATLLLVGVQHEVALGGVECVRSGMSAGSVLKNGGVLYTGTIFYVNEISGCGGFYLGEAATARYDIITEPGTLRQFERFEARASEESTLVYRCHFIQREFRQ
jgi:hypothetical protein